MTNWSLHAKILFDKTQNIFMMISGLSSLHMNYNADAIRRLKIHDILPLNYSQHLKLKYNYTPKISEKLIALLFEGDVVTAQRQESKVKREVINLRDYDENDWEPFSNMVDFVHY